MQSADRASESAKLKNLVDGRRLRDVSDLLLHNRCVLRVVDGEASLGTESWNFNGGDAPMNRRTRLAERVLLHKIEEYGFASCVELKNGAIRSPEHTLKMLVERAVRQRVRALRRYGRLLATTSGLDVLCGTRDRFVICNVDRHKSSAELIGCGLAALRVAGADDDGLTDLDEAASCLVAEALVSPGDEGDGHADIIALPMVLHGFFETMAAR